MLTPKSHKSLLICKLPIVQRTKKLPGLLSLGGNFLKTIAEHSLLRPTIEKSIKKFYLKEFLLNIWHFFI